MPNDVNQSRFMGRVVGLFIGVILTVAVAGWAKLGLGATFILGVIVGACFTALGEEIGEHWYDRKNR